MDTPTQNRLTIDLKHTRESAAQSAQTSAVSVRRTITFFAVIVSVVLLMSCECKPPTLLTDTAAGPLSFGELGHAGDFGVEVLKAQDPYIPPPKAPESDEHKGGKTRLIAVKVKLHHRTGRENLKYSTLKWHLYDHGGRKFEALYPDNRVKQPKLSEGYLTPENFVMGWVTFELPKDSIPQRVQFFEDFLSGNLAEFTFPVPK